MVPTRIMYGHLDLHVVPLPYTYADIETYIETTTATDRDLDDTDAESVRICRHTVPNLSPPPLVLVVVVLLSSPIAEGRSLFSLRGHL